MNTKDPKGCYAILGVYPNADLAMIKAAFRRKGMELHPDRNKAPNATEHFQLLNEAYGVLSDPVARTHYDTMSLDSRPRAAGSAAAKETPEPIVCSCCSKVTAQPSMLVWRHTRHGLSPLSAKPISLVPSHSTLSQLRRRSDPKAKRCRRRRR